jgi:hypothetical protein
VLRGGGVENRERTDVAVVARILEREKLLIEGGQLAHV